MEPWDGTIDAMSYGYVAPTISNPKPNNEIKVVHRMWASDEDCLYLNVWTPSIHDDNRRPVLVWLHGGGFFAGSSIEQVCYDGKALAEIGDVVVITVNHRLNLLGFLDMSPYGEQFANSANAGMQDLVEALRWIQTNIAAFGGDPDNVTLFGQSGGSMKIDCLMQTPEAENLFHKAYRISGTLAEDETRHDVEVVKGLLEHLHIPEENAAQLAEVPLQDLMEAYRQTQQSLQEQGITVTWAPCRNEWYLGNPLQHGFTEGARRKPLVMAGVFSELNHAGAGISDKQVLSREQRLERLLQVYGIRTAALVEAFTEAYPGRNELDLLRLDNRFRMPTIRLLEQRATEHCAPTYDVMFVPDFPLDNGSPAWHCSDLPFYFHNIDRIPVSNGLRNAPELEHQMAGALIQFARTGNPNGEGLLDWPEYNLADRATLILDEELRIGRAYDHRLYALYTACQAGQGRGEQLQSGGHLRDII